MEFEKIISVSGYGSLYKIVSQSNFGLVAESLADKKRMPVYQSYNVSTLVDISIYTTEGEVSLKEVFIKIFEKEEGKETAVVKEKDPEIKKYFESILPDYDKERVYTSDIKKLFKWYNQLVSNNLLDPEELKKEEETTEEDATEKETDKKAEKSADKKDATTKKETKKSTTKKPATKTAAKTKPANIKNAPAKKVQTVRKSGGS